MSLQMMLFQIQIYKPKYGEIHSYISTTFQRFFSAITTLQIVSLLPDLNLSLEI